MRWLFALWIGTGVPALALQTDDLIAKLMMKERASYYGTSLLIEQDDEHLFFVTNAHNLPAKPERVRLQSPLLGYRDEAFTVVGVAPGYDLAVLAVKRGKVEREGLATLIEETILVDKLPSGAFRWGLYGYPGAQTEVKPALEARTWAEVTEGDLRTLLKMAPLPPRKPNELSREMALGLEGDCPPLFVALCYLVPIRSWGYSGGALLTAPAGGPLASKRLIAGLISHYAALSQMTYAIPMPMVKEVVGRLRKEAKEHGNGVIWKGNLKGGFEYLGRNRVRDVARGEIVRGRGATIGNEGGSGEGVGGGSGEGVGGGDDGIIRNATGITYRAPYADVAAELFAEVPWTTNAKSHLRRLLPALPAFRGADAILHYLPGVEIGDGEKFKTAFLYGSGPLDTVQDFVNFRTGRPDYKIRFDFPKAPPLPWELELATDRLPRAGLHSFAGVKRAGETLVSTPQMSEISTIGVARLGRDGKRYKMEIGDSNFGFFGLELADKFNQVGPYTFRYEGNFDLTDPDKRRIKATGIAVLHYLADDKFFELKIILASEHPTDKEHLVFDGFYLPLSQPAR